LTKSRQKLGSGLTALLLGKKSIDDDLLEALEMLIIVKTDRRAPIFISQLWYQVGASNESRPMTGISHMLEHMMFKGTHPISFHLNRKFKFRLVHFLIISGVILRSKGIVITAIASNNL
jgi:hypothetical protein